MKSICLLPLLLVCVGSLLLSTGCASQPPEEKRATASPSDAFPPDDASRSVWRVLESQTAAGAAHDGMLYEGHFDGSELNDAGRDKLDLMTRASGRPVVVYLNIPDSDDRGGRAESVERWLRSAGLEPDGFTVEFGLNPGTTSPSAYGLSRLSKTESPGAAGSGAGTDTDASN